MSVFIKMRELNADRLARGGEKLAAGEEVEILEHFAQENGIETFIVGSAESVHEVHIFVGRFAFCDCGDFKHRRYETCRHIARIAPKFCKACDEKEVKKFNSECRGCSIENAIYLKESPKRAKRIIGGIPV